MTHANGHHSQNGHADPRIIGLGAELERISRRQDHLETRLLQLAEDLTALVPPANEHPEPLPSWLTATRAPEAAERLAELADWLARVYLRYSDADLPSCWAWHPDVVEELWWLRHAHHAAYDGPRASWREIGDWHDRHRPGVITRIKAAIGTCDLARHHTNGDATTPPPVTPMTGHLTQIAEHWTTHRAAPTPTDEQQAEARQYDSRHLGRHRPQ